MENEVIERFKMHDRMEVVSFLKSIWNENPMPCPFCGSSLDFLHKKAKKDNCDWKSLLAREADSKTKDMIYIILLRNTVKKK